MEENREEPIEESVHTDKNREKVSEESVNIEKKKNEEYRIWRALLIASVIVGACYFICGFILRLIGNHFTEGSARISAENMAVIKSIVDKVIMLVRPWMVIVIMALALYSSIRFSIKKAAALCAVYALVAFIMALMSFRTSVSLFQISSLFTGTLTTSITLKTLVVNFILDIFSILINSAGILFLPRLLKKQKNEIILFSLCVLILVIFSSIVSIFIAALFYKNNLSHFAILISLAWNLVKNCIIMGLTYAVIRIVLYAKSHKTA